MEVTETPINPLEEAIRRVNAGEVPKEAARACGISPATLASHLKQRHLIAVEAELAACQEDLARSKEVWHVAENQVPLLRDAVLRGVDPGTIGNAFFGRPLQVAEVMDGLMRVLSIFDQERLYSEMLLPRPWTPYVRYLTGKP